MTQPSNRKVCFEQHLGHLTQRWVEHASRLSIIEPETRALASAASSSSTYRLTAAGRNRPRFWSPRVIAEGDRIVVLGSAESALPDRSDVGVAAGRNFDGQPPMDALIALLCRFDSAVARLARRPR